MYILYSFLLCMGAYICMWLCMSAHMQKQLPLGFFFSSFPFVLFLPFGDRMEDKYASENSSENIMQRGLNMMSNSPSTGLCGLSYLLCKNERK